MRYYSNTAQEATLSATVGAAATTLSVGGTAGFPTSTPYTLVVDADTSAEEIVTVTAVAGTNLTVIRGEEDSSAMAHDAGATVRHYHTARDFAEPQAHQEATSNVHGTTGALVGTTNPQALSNKDLSAGTNTLPVDVTRNASTQTLTNKTLGATNTLNGFTASRLMQSDATGKLAASSKTIPVGAIVGTSDAQALTNKDLTGAGNTFPPSLAAAADIAAAVYGGAARTARPFGKLTRQSNVSIPDSTATQLDFSTLAEQTDAGMASAANNTITVPIAGLYEVAVYVNFVANGVGRRLVRLKINSNNAYNNNVLPPNAGGTPVQLTPPPFRLAAGDVLSVDVYQTSGAALNLTENSDGGYQEFSALWVAP